ncbi:MAG: hypothetical protein P1U74_03255 [Legionellaceae bacterium]|nr:hypothetical protein [Legionellaceae bacterium]
MPSQEMKILIVGSNEVDDDSDDDLSIIDGWSDDSSVEFWTIAKSASIDSVTSDSSYKVDEQNYSSIVVCFEIESEKSFRSAQKHLVQVMRMNDARLIDVPVVLVGLNSLAVDRQRIMTKHESVELAEHLNVVGYYEVTTNCIQDILENPELFAAGSLFDEAESIQAAELNRDIISTSKSFQKDLSGLARPITNLINMLEGLNKSKKNSFVKQEESCAILNHISDLITKNCPLNELKQNIKDLRMDINKISKSLQAALLDYKKHNKSQLSSLFVKDEPDFRHCIEASSAVSTYLDNIENLLSVMHDDEENRPPSPTYQ